MAFRVLRRRESDFSAEARPEPLMHIASRANDALGKLDADLRAGGFGPNSRGLARELYASFTATAVGVRGTEDEAIAWGIGRALAIDLDTAGARRSALALLRGLIAFGASHADPQILERLKRTEEAIDPKMASRRRGEEKARKVPDRPTAGPKPSVQDPPLRPANRETSSPKGPTLESDIGKAPGRPWRVWRVKPSAPSGNAPPQSLSDPAGGASGTKPAAVPDPAGASRPPLDRTNEAANAARSTVVAEPEPVAPVLRTKSPTPIPETPLTELEKASETRPAVVFDPAEVPRPLLERTDQAADVARRAKVAESKSIAPALEPVAPALETESPTPIPETSRAVAPDPAETSWPPLERTDQAADAVRSEVVAEPEPVVPARQTESPTPIPETPPSELGAASETGPAAAPDPAETSWPPFDRRDERADAAQSEVAAEPKPVAPALQTESPTPIQVTPPTERREASETRPAVAPYRAKTLRPPLDQTHEAAAAVRSAVAAEPEPVAPARQTESPTPIPETPPTGMREASETRPAAAPDSTETSWPPLDRTHEAAAAVRRAVVAEPEPVAPALEMESPTPIPETPPNEWGAASKTRPAAAPDPTGTSWPPLDRRGEAADTVRRAVAAESEPVAPALEAEAPAPIPETPLTEIHFGPEPDPKPYGQRDEEQWRSGEGGGRDYMDREEPRLVHADHKLFVEKGLRIAPDERPVLASARPRYRRGSKLLVGAAAALVGIALYLLISHDRSFLQQPGATLTRIATLLTDPTAPPKNASSGAAAARTAASTDGDAPEKVPSPGSGRLLSSEEVRYCVFQGRRLGYLRSQVTSNAWVQRFNELVTDFNSRCSHFRFENKALQAALELAAARQVQLKADADKILASWPSNEVGVLIDLQKYDGAFAVQARLRKLGYYHHTVDGVWGPMSADALSKFRRQTALGVDGTWDLATQLALLGR
jgi:hypothetical protein